QPLGLSRISLSVCNNKATPKKSITDKKLFRINPEATLRLSLLENAASGNVEKLPCLSSSCGNVVNKYLFKSSLALAETLRIFFRFSIDCLIFLIFLFIILTILRKYLY